VKPQLKAPIAPACIGIGTTMDCLLIKSLYGGSKFRVTFRTLQEIPRLLATVSTDPVFGRIAWPRWSGDRIP
jgi:hypothetical protein